MPADRPAERPADRRSGRVCLVLALAGVSLGVAAVPGGAATQPAPVSVSTSVTGAFAELLPDLNGDGVPEVELVSGIASVVRDGRSGRVLLKVGLGSTLLPARVGPGHAPGLEVVASAFGSPGGSGTVVSAYAGSGHLVWQHRLPHLVGPVGADSSSGSSTGTTASLDGPGSSDLVVAESLAADDDSGRHRLLRVTSVDAATGAVHRLVDLTEGGVRAALVPLGGHRDGLIVDHRDSATSTTLSGLDGQGRPLWTKTLTDGTSLGGALPLGGFTGDPSQSLQASFGLSLGAGIGSGGSDSGPDVLLSLGGAVTTTTGFPSAPAAAHAQLIDARTGAVRWDRAGQLAGLVIAGGGRGPAALVSTQSGRTLTIAAVERSGATRWSHAVHLPSAGPALAIAGSIGNLGGGPGTEIAVSVLQPASKAGDATLVLDGGTGRTLHPKGLEGLTGSGPTAPGVAEGATIAPGGTLATLRAVTGQGGRTTVTRRDLGAARDRWSVTVGGPGAIAESVDGAAGPHGCGSVAVSLGSSQSLTTLAVVGLTGGQARWTLDLATGKVTPGPRSATAC